MRLALKEESPPELPLSSSARSLSSISTPETESPSDAAEADPGWLVGGSLLSMTASIIASI